MIGSRALLFGAILVALGAAWGFTQPMTKISVSTGHGHFGLIFWQTLIGAALMAAICTLRGTRLPLHPRHLWLYTIIALVGTVIPNSASYQAAVHLPAGIMSLILSTIPMLAFPLALALGNDRYEARRLLGLTVGLAAVLLIILPGQEMSGGIPPFWVLVLLFTCLCYAFEGNYVQRWGTQNLDALQVLYGASLVGAVMTFPMALASGQWIDPTRPWGAPELALIAGSVAHVVAYAGYVWLVGQAGVTFTAQISYVVTLTGLFWAKLILDERYPAQVWLALGLLFVGMYLVQPRRSQPLDASPPIGQDSRNRP